ncbi:MAG TPA: hypothetical protein VKA30_09860 [Actinomycetota bacterium]|nr:hypothetical protein [Actinomycetota bacterium]
MSIAVETLDCPKCRSAGAVQGGTCQICDAELEVPLRFADVIDELRVIASLAEADDTAAGRAVIHACLRAEALLGALRDQFMIEVVGVGGRA